MPFVKLMGITLPVLEGAGEVEIINQGGYGRTFLGSPYNAVRASSDEYPGQWPIVPRAISTAYGLLVRGVGQSFRFVAAGVGTAGDYYSTTALALYDVNVDLSYRTYATGGPVNNGGRLELAFIGNMTWRIAPSPLLQATLSCWVRNAIETDGQWKHYVVESSGAAATSAWVNGVSTSPASLPLDIDTWLTHPTSGGEAGWLSLNVQVDSEEATDVGEVLALPYRVSQLESGWPTYLYNGGAGLAAEDLSHLTMSGDWAPSGSATVLGEVTGPEQLRTVTVDGSTQLYASRSFRLRATNTEA